MLWQLSQVISVEKRNRKSFITALGCALILVSPALSCSEEKKLDKTKESVPQAIELLPDAIAVDNYLVMIDTASDRAFIVDASAKDLAKGTRVVTDLNPNISRLEIRKGKEKEALVLSAGLRGVSKSTMLSVLSVTNGTLRNYTAGNPFDSLIQSEDGKYALLYFGKGSDTLLYNRNQIAVVALTAPKVTLDGKSSTGTASTEAVNLNVTTPGGEPTQIALSPALTFGSRSRMLAAVLSQGYATLVDITDTKRTTQVQLVGDIKRDAIVPEQVLFSATRREIYIRGSNSEDVFILRLTEDAENEGDFTTSVDQVAVGTEPADVAQYGDAEAGRLLVVSGGNREIDIVELPAVEISSDEGDSEESDGETTSKGDVAESPASPRATRIALAHKANRALIFEAGSPQYPDEIESRALLYQIGGTELSFLNLVDAETLKEENLETLTVREPISKIIVLRDQKLAVLLHESARIDVLDLTRRKMYVVPVNGSIENAISFSELPVPRLWVAPKGQYLFGYIDLKSGKTGEILLDNPLSQLVIMPNTKSPTASLIVPIQEKDGKVTITIIKLNNNPPTRDTSVSFSDFPTVPSDADAGASSD